MLTTGGTVGRSRFVHLTQLHIAATAAAAGSCSSLENLRRLLPRRVVSAVFRSAMTSTISFYHRNTRFNRQAI